MSKSWRARAVLLLVTAGALLAGPAAAAQAAPPDGVTAMALDGRVELTWQPAAGATGYKVYRGTSPTAVTTPLMTTPFQPPDLSVPASYTDITPVNGTTYYYSVRSIISGVESTDSRIIAATPRAKSCTSGNVIVQENCRPGDSDWEATTAQTAIRAYATASTIDHGESVGLKVSAPGISQVDIEVFRSGYYGGAGARLFSTIRDVPVATQPACTSDTTLGLYDCSTWSTTYTLTTTTNWPSGVYLLRVKRRSNGDSTHILLTIRDDERHSPILYGIPDTTYQAYNNYGGKSTYPYNSTGANTVTGQVRAAKVSWDRPYEQQHHTNEHDWYTLTDYAMVYWLEQSGYDVSYQGASDLETRGASVQDHRIYISGAHDEYWSSAMRTALEQARDRGVKLFFTGSNELFWRIRFEPSIVSGKANRTLVVYKTAQSGPADPSGISTSTWRDPAGPNNPENALAGGMYVGQQASTYFPLRVSAAQGKDRIWRYTGLENQAAGTSTNIGAGLLGWEWDARVTNGAQPAGVTVLASSPGTGDILQDAAAVYAPGTVNSEVLKYTTASGSLIVSTGTNHWNWGLALEADGEGEPDRRIQQATTNILVDMGAYPDTPASNMVLDDPNAPPAIVAKAPSSGETNVDLVQPVVATFSRSMNGSTITSSSYTLRRPDNSIVPATVSYDDITFRATLTPTSPLATNTAYTVRLEPTVAAANGIALGTAQTWSFTTRPPDSTNPVATLTAPANGSTVVKTATITADANDNVAVAGVQFKVDGANIGSEDTTVPYSVSWDASGVSAGNHTLTAVARDTSGNLGTSSAVTVTVDPTGLVAAYGFEETSGTSAVDSSGKGNGGTLVNGVTRSTSGKFGRALQFDGVDDMVTIPDSPSLDLTNAMTLEAWVNPSTLTAWRTVMMKEQSTGLVYGMYANTDTNRPSAHVFTTSEIDTRGTAQVATNVWTHLAATYDGTTLRMYVNGTQVSSKTVTGNMINSTGALRIGANSIWGERFTGRIDEVRVYRRVLSPAEIGTDMNTAIVNPDTQAPTAPGSLNASGGLGQAQLTWTAATDDTGVDHYNVYRSTTSGFTPSTSNRVAQVTGTSFTDAGIPSGTYYYRVTAEDAVGNVGPATAEASATVTGDTAAPSVSLTAPAEGASLSGTVNVTANASDNVGVIGVQFKVDGGNLGTEDTSAPYSFSWATGTIPNGSHTLTAVARDAAGNATTSAAVHVTVTNTGVDPTGLVAAYGFEEASGTTATDSSTAGNNGTLTNGPVRTTTGKFGNALQFDGTNDIVTVPDANSLDLTNAMTLEAWVDPTTLSGFRTALMKQGSGELAYSLYANTSTSNPSTHVFTTSEQDTRGTSQIPLNTWTHLASTYDGSTLRLYVNGTLASSKAVSGSMAPSSGPLQIGGNTIWSEWFTGQIDEVRVYSRVLSAAEVAQDMNTPVKPLVTDTQAPTAPGSLSAAGSLGQAQLTWSAASDNVGVDHYNVYRSTTSGFTPSTSNRIAQVTGTTYTDAGLASGTYYYRVTAEDAAHNVGPATAEANATVTGDTTAPTVSITAPANGSTVSGSVNVTANAADNVGVTSVQFKLDGADLGSADTSSPYSVTWPTGSTPNGSHTLTAVAKDAANNSTTSATVTVTVSNTGVDPTGLVGAYGFEETTGTSVTDSSPAGNTGTINGATRTTTGKFGRALSFNGSSNWVTVGDTTSLHFGTGFTLEAWVNPTATTGWRTVALKEQTGGLTWALYANTDTNRPSGHVNTGTEFDTRGTAQVPANTWTHLAVTYDGATLRLYVNGTQASSKAVTGAISASTGALRIGGNNIWPEWFAGQIDEIRIYSRALTASEIPLDMNRPVVG